MASAAKIIADIRRLPPRVVLRKVAFRAGRLLQSRFDRLLAARQRLELSDRSFARQVLQSGESLDDWAGRFSRRLATGSLLRDARGLRARLSPLQIAHCLATAEEACQHRFDLLGSGLVHVTYGMRCKGRSGHRYEMLAEPGREAFIRGEVLRQLPGLADYRPIDWHLDFISGFRWSELDWHADIHATRVPGADIKVPWELSRGYHLPGLARAAGLSGEHRHALEVQAQILDFVVSNPVGFGPCWACPMDAAIRMVNWLVALGCLAELGMLVPAALWRIARSLCDHARFIRRNIEWSAEVRGNHYTADLAGLMFYGLLCPSLPGARRLERFARRELESEVFQQVHPDGTNFEASTLYHRLVLELFLYPALVAERVGLPFRESYRKQLLAMTEVMRNLAFSSGELGQIGDYDSGRLLVLGSRPPGSRHVDCLLASADMMLNGALASYPEGVDLLAARTLHGTPLAEPDGSGWLGRRSAGFPDSGWYVLRSAGFEVLASCGPNGQAGNGGHAHNDKLAVSVSVDGHPLLVDPGTYLYTPDPIARNRFRGTALHSTPQPGEAEISPILPGPGGLFTLPDRSRVRVLVWRGRNLQAVHEGFGEPVTLDLDLDGTGVRCRYSVGQGKFRLRWYLAPGVHASLHPTGRGLVLAVGGQRHELFVDEGALRMFDYDFSPEYGRVERSQAAEVEFEHRICWVLRRAA